MPQFQLLKGDQLPEVPPERKYNPGRYAPLLEKAREANGDWIAVRAQGELPRNMLPNLAARIRSGRVLGASKDEFEVRVRTADRTLWIRSVRGETDPIPKEAAHRL